MLHSHSQLLPLVVIFWGVTLCQGQGAGPPTKAPQDNDPKANSTDQVYLYRLINWCVVGRGEYWLSEWPLNQFKPILHETHRNELQHQADSQERIDAVVGNTGVDPWDKYELTIGPISCQGLTGLGLGDGSGNFLQRIHIQFKAKSTDRISFQGLMIQAVHAPFGLGFPFGVFDTDYEFKCNDCDFFNLSRIVGCLSRPDHSPMHPTVAMFHYKLRGATVPPAPPPGAPPPPPLVEREYGYRHELHWNFKWTNLPCTSARLVEFWILMVIDFEQRVWSVKKFGPYDLNDYTFSSSLETPKTTTATSAGEIHVGIPTPIVSNCYPFENYPLIITNKGRPHVCFRNYISYNRTQCDRWEKKIRKTDPTAPPPAQPGTPPSAVVYKPYKNEMVCHGASSVPTELKQKTRVRVVGEFDVDCTLRFPGKLYEKMTLKLRRQPGKICPEWQGKMTCSGTQADLEFDTKIQGEGSTDGNRSFPGSHCTPCKPVTEEQTPAPNDQEPFFKREEHGVLMIFAFFFFNPVSLNIARFYKETLHQKQKKGWRMWLIIHVGFAAFASIFSYVGYTYPSFKEMDAHIILGYGAMIGVSSGIITGWFRHKNQYVQTCMFYVHALSGYLGWGLAIASMVFAPLISKWTRLVSYMASGICLVAMAIMTVHICSVDGNLGVRPKRSHFPIIEVRFDDIIPPKPLFRKIFLYLYVAIQFLVCFGMLVL